MSNRRVLVNYLGRKGGGATYAFEMTKGLINNGEIVSAIIPSTIENINAWKELNLENLYFIDTYSDKKSFIVNTLLFIFFKQWGIRKVLKKCNFDICYIPMIQPWSFLINNMVKKAKIIATIHDPIPHSGSSKLLQFIFVNQLVAKKADKVVILSSVFFDYVVKNYKKKPEQISVIPHGIFDYSKCSNGIPVIRNKQFNFLFFGLIGKYKGINLLLNAYNRLKCIYDDISLYIVGKGDMKDYSESIDSGKDITVVNRFIDDSEVAAYFQGNNVITVLPYIDATQSGVVPIAMREESLLIVTNTGGLVEQTNNGEFALLCEPNEDTVFNAMKYAVEHYEECREKIYAAKKHADELSWDNLASKLID